MARSAFFTWTNRGGDMPRSGAQRPVLIVSGNVRLPPAILPWEHELVAPVLAQLLGKTSVGADEPPRRADARG